MGKPGAHMMGLSMKRNGDPSFMYHSKKMGKTAQLSMMRAGDPYVAATPHPGHVDSKIPQAPAFARDGGWHGTDAQDANYDCEMQNPGGKWIQKAIKHPGALHRQLGVPADKKIPAKKMAAAKAGKKGPLAAKRANLAKTLSKF